MKDTDSLLDILKIMRDQKVSCVPLEKGINSTPGAPVKTIALSYLFDLMFLLKLPNFWKYLEEPAINLVIELNGLDEPAD